MSQRIIPQPALGRALQRRLSTPAISHDFDVVSDPPAQRAKQAQDGHANAEPEPPAK